MLTDDVIDYHVQIEIRLIICYRVQFITNIIELYVNQLNKFTSVISIYYDRHKITLIFFDCQIFLL